MSYMMSFFRRAPFLFFVGSLSILGAGCQVPTRSPSSAENSSSLSSASSTEIVAQRLQFLSGDSFEIKQTLFGLDSSLSDLFSAYEGTRLVTVQRFVPMREADLHWLSTIEHEATSSQRARQLYQAQIQRRKKGDAYPPPPPVETERVSASGDLVHINLHEPHTLFLPAYWKVEGETSALTQKSGLWLSDDAFEELIVTHKTVVYLDLFGEVASQWAKRSQELQGVLDRLRQRANIAGEKKDVALLEVEPQPIEWPVVINGQEVKVSAWHGKNAFADFVILNNRQNPLILKLTIQPIFPGATEIVTGQHDWKKVFGYEVNHFLVQTF